MARVSLRRCDFPLVSGGDPSAHSHVRAGLMKNDIVAVSRGEALILGSEEYESFPCPVSLFVLVLHSHKQTEFFVPLFEDFFDLGLF